jgi:carbamoyltransferase
MNCVANSRILAESPFQRVFIPPDPGDGGTAVGTSLYYAAVNAPQPVGRKTYGPYLGAAFDEAPDVAMVDYVQTDHIVPYLKKEVPAVPGVRWKKQTYGSDEELCAEVSRRLHAGAIVGWYQGRAELGPRALGNRSILARPDDVDVVARLSRAVKERAAFRPYALSIAAEAAAEVLQLGRAQPSDARWMQFAFPVQAAVVDRVRCGLHVDGTTRAQVCTAADNPLFHRLLLEFGREFGIPVLINTSFNASGYPIVSTPVDAMSMFARTDMDVLVLNRTLLWKERGA